MNPQDSRNEMFVRTFNMLKPALERVASDAVFRERLEQSPLAVLDEMHIEIDPGTRADLQGRKFSEFWAARRRAVEGPVQVRDLPPDTGTLSDRDLDAVVGGVTTLTGVVHNFAPPYVPVGPG